MFSIGIIRFISVRYRLYLYSSSQHGKSYGSVFSCCSGKVREYLLIILHWLPLNVLILKGGLLVFY